MQINEANNNQALSLNQGQSLELSLQGNPTTGFTWSFVAAPDASVLTQTSHDYVPSSQAIGAGGTEHWVFQAVGPGSTSISLNYSRPWESVPPAKTFTVQVSVGSGTPGSGTPGTGEQNQVRFVIGSSSYVVNGKTYQMDAAAFIQNDRSYVPVRYLVAALGLQADQISWDAASKTILLPPDQNGARFSVRIGDNNIYRIDAEGKSSIFQTMDAAPVIRNGRTCLPARYIAALYGGSVSWDGSERAISILTHT
jgi:predicted secreted protein